MGLHRALLLIAGNALKLSAATVLEEEGWEAVTADSHLVALCYLVPLVGHHPMPDSPELVVCDTEGAEYLASLHIGGTVVTIVPVTAPGDLDALRAALAMRA